jgi:tetratricopeptide (TPR) repeat protein
MAPSSDEHLETALREYNDKVSRLEFEGGTEEEFLDAYINRGCILSMMEYYVSAISDFDDAIEIMAHLEASGKRIDAGTFVKAFISRGEICGGEDLRPMADDYALAATRLNDLKEDSKYYSRKKIVMMCIGCVEDLVDEGFPAEVEPFLNKAWSMLLTKEDPWSKNRYMEMLNLKGQSEIDMEMKDEAMESFSDAISVGTGLLELAVLDDMMSLVFAFVSRGDIEQEKGLLDQYIKDRKSAIVLLEQMMEANKLDDVHILAQLHQDLANTYLTLNNVKEAEEHLMREVALDMNGAKEYIQNFSNRPIVPK